MITKASQLALFPFSLYFHSCSPPPSRLLFQKKMQCRLCYSSCSKSFNCFSLCYKSSPLPVTSKVLPALAPAISVSLILSVSCSHSPQSSLYWSSFSFSNNLLILLWMLFSSLTPWRDMSVPLNLSLNVISWARHFHLFYLKSVCHVLSPTLLFDFFLFNFLLFHSIYNNSETLCKTISKYSVCGCTVERVSHLLNALRWKVIPVMALAPL